MKIMRHLAAGNPPLVRVGPFTTSATPGTRTAHAHGLIDENGFAVIPDVAIAITTGSDDNVDNSVAIVQFVKSDATNVTVKSHVASVAFYLYVG